MDPTNLCISNLIQNWTFLNYRNGVFLFDGHLSKIRNDRLVGKFRQESVWYLFVFVWTNLGNCDLKSFWVCRPWLLDPLHWLVNSVKKVKNQQVLLIVIHCPYTVATWDVNQLPNWGIWWRYGESPDPFADGAFSFFETFRTSQQDKKRPSFFPSEFKVQAFFQLWSSVAWLCN